MSSTDQSRVTHISSEDIKSVQQEMEQQLHRLTGTEQDDQAKADQKAINDEFINSLKSR